MVYTITPLLHADIIITATTVHSLVGITPFLLLFGEGISVFSFLKIYFQNSFFFFTLFLKISFYPVINQIDG